MHLALTPHRRLQQLYGAAYPALATNLNSALQARANAGIASLDYDPEAGIPDLGVAPTTLTPTNLSAQLGAIECALEAHNGIMIESLWIVGGPDSIPFGSLPNPMRDRDGPILSDCVYGLADATNLLTRWPVGRTPGLGPAGQPDLSRLLMQTANAHWGGQPSIGPTLGISTARWAAVSADVLASSGNPDTHLLLAPPLQAGQLDQRQIRAARWIYCNLHGVPESTTWYGQSTLDHDLTPALRPADLAGLDLAGCVVISQACFGARLQAGGAEPTMAATILERGAILIGAIGLAYGSPDPPASESDLLTQQLLIALRQPGQRLGAAFQAAHAALMRDLLRRQGGLDADDIKTLLSFVLYGDPALPA